MKNLKRFAFTLQLLAVLALAALGPELGEQLQQHLPLKKMAIATIFALTGLGLRTRHVFDQVGQIPTHVVTQLLCFIAFPCAVLATHWPFDSIADGQLSVGLYALAAVPTTISSCVVFTSLAGGNSAAAMFNAVLGNVLGIVVSPFVFLLLARAGAVELQVDKLGILLKIGVLVLLPFVAGQLARLRCQRFAEARRPLFRRINSSAILLVVYLAFCGLFSQGPSGLRAVHFVGLGVYAGLLNLLMLALAAGAGRLSRFGRGERIAVLFAASQKTLAMGLPLTIAFCEQSPHLTVEIVALPLIFYHAIQLVVGSFVIERLRDTAGEGHAGAVGEQAQGVDK